MPENFEQRLIAIKHNMHQLIQEINTREDAIRFKQVLLTPFGLLNKSFKLADNGAQRRKKLQSGGPYQP